MCLEKANVIKREVEPTDWVSSLVVTEKPNGKLRVCNDPHHLNKALKYVHSLESLCEKCFVRKSLRGNTNIIDCDDNCNLLL